MTVKELIAELILFNEDLEVFADIGAARGMEIKSVDFLGFSRRFDGVIDLTYAGQPCVTLREVPHEDLDE